MLKPNPDAGPGARPLDDSRVTSPLRFWWLIGLFFTGFLLVVGLNKLFSSLADELGQRSANERARLFVGEEVVRNIQGIEMDVYRMAMAVGLAAQERVERELLKKVAKLEHDLLVLREGGTVQQLIYLNVEGMDQMVREATFKPALEDRGHVMEIIEIGPHIDQIKVKVRQLRALLTSRDEYRARVDGKAMIKVSSEILAYFKHLPPFFFRLNENANRLFFETQQRLQRLDARLAAQRERYKATEMGLIVLVIGSVTVIGIVFARQIKRSNEKLARAWGEMRVARDQAERASRAKSDFLSRMSHELRTPMNAILGFAQLLDNQALSPVQRDYSRQIRAAGQHLLGLIGDILDLAKIEAGRLVLEHITFDLGRLIDDVVAVADKRAKAKGLTIKVLMAPEAPHQVIGDPTRLRQVLINLLDNAVKFTERGEIGIDITPDQADGKCRFRVWDTGIGMEEGVVEKLFKPFTQADESMTRKYGGSGLGLVICKDLVTAMGGNLQVTSRLGHGTAFCFALPLVSAASALDPPSAGQPTPVESGALADDDAGDLSVADALPKGRVLLVEDNVVNQLVAAGMLEALGVICETAAHGLEALEKLHQGGDYDLIFMDVQMPLMDGYTATRQIRQWESEQGTRRIPVIAMTANAMAEDRAHCIASGMDDYLAKPYEIGVLASMLRRWLPSAANA